MEPRTDLDARFSEPGATATSWPVVEQAIADAQQFWVTTVRTGGAPHVTPLVAVWVDGALYFCTGPEEQKAVNLRSNQQVVLTTGCNTWNVGLDVVVEGVAAPVTDATLLRRLAEAWTKKWDGSWQFEVIEGGFRSHGGEGLALVFEVRPTKILSFAKETFAETRHVF
jgi:general stress protein 26